MSGRRSEVNGWTCDLCGRTTYVVHVEDGVTPFMLACRAEGVDPRDARCDGMGTSLMYPPPPVPEHVLRAVAWEWYAPGREELKAQDAQMRAHVERGGLMLRPLTDAGRAVLKGLS